MHTSNNYDLIIVGCGPTGATLANLMRTKGYKVAIFDRDNDIFHAPRAMVLDEESCRIYQQMGILSRLMQKDASPFTHHKFVNKNRKKLMAVDASLARSLYSHPPAGVMFHQPALEAMLRSDFDQGVKVDSYLGYEVLAVDGKGEQASIVTKHLATGDKFNFSAKFIVGADGGDSLCRRYMDANRVDLNYSRSWIVMDVIVHDKKLWNSFSEGSEFRCRPGAAVVFVKGHHQHVRFDFEVDDKTAESFNKGDAYHLISEYFDTDSIEIIRMAPYRFYAGMPDQWRKNRVLIAGDAAHQTSPFAGQGLNMGIRDAVNLAFKFDMVFKGKLNNSFLNTYQQERWDNCAHLIRGASARGKMIGASNFWEIISRDIAFFVGRNSKWLSFKMTKRMSDSSAYNAGFIGNQHTLSGSPFPQPTVKNGLGESLLLDDLLGDRFVLLSLHKITGSAAQWFAQELNGLSLTIGQDFIDSENKLADYFKRHRINSILIRPDRYVFDAGNNAEDLCKVLRASLADYSLLAQPCDLAS